MRRYRLDKNGHEQPVWLSDAKIRDLGSREGEEAARNKRQPIHYGNLIYDKAARGAYEIKSAEMKLGRNLTDREMSQALDRAKEKA
jgi:hypothetical protein